MDLWGVARAQDRERLASLRSALIAARSDSVLFDSERFVRNLENAYEAMFARFEKGVEPAPITDIQAFQEAAGDESKPKVAQALSVELLLEQGEVLLQQERIREAKERFDTVLGRQSDNAQAWHGIGLVYALAGQYESARSHVEKALAQEPEKARYAKSLSKIEEKAERSYAATLAETLKQAQATHQGGDLDTAISLYRQILQTSPRHPTALHYLGLAQVQRGEFSGLEQMRESLNVQPHNQTFLDNYRRAQRMLDTGLEI